MMMRSCRRRSLLLVSIFVLAAGLRAGRVRGAAEPSAETALRELVATYARAVDGADTDLAAKVWSTTPDVSFIHPLGHARGWGEVERFFEETMGGLLTERKLLVKDVVVNAYRDAAWVEFYWSFTAKLRKDGSPVATSGRETQVYRKTADGWRLVHVHYSGMPVKGDGQGF